MVKVVVVVRVFYFNCNKKVLFFFGVNYTKTTLTTIPL